MAEHVVIKHVAGRATVERLAEELPFCVTNAEWGLTYQKCRFCERSATEVEPRYVSATLGRVRGLYKYGVRHYVCEHCRDHFKQLARLLPRPGGPR